MVHDTDEAPAEPHWLTLEHVPNITLPGFATQAFVGPGVEVAPGGGVGVAVAPGGGDPAGGVLVGGFIGRSVGVAVGF